jgi:hypothetical protein
MRKKFSRFTTLVCLPLLACGGNSTNNKTVKVPDSKPVDTAPIACKAAASYASLGSGGFGGDAPAVMSGSANTAHQQVGLEPVSATDAFYLELNGDFGGFGSGDIKPGTYALAGDDIDYGACGVCVQLWPQSIDGSGHLPTDPNYYLNETYMAASGSVTLTMAGGGSGTILSGSVSNIAFKHVTLASDRTQTYSADNCSTSLTGGSFSITLLYFGSAAAAAPSNDYHQAGQLEDGRAVMVRLGNRHF